MNKSKSDSELIEKTNDAISELVYDKHELLKAYNYYNGERDAELFKYLEDNFGIGNPTSIEFTPLISKHINALIGEYLDTPILPKISCKDAKTISSITREKELTISREIYTALLKKLTNKLLDFMESGNSNKLQDPYIQQFLDNLIEDLNSNFISKFEIASQNVVQYLMQDRKTDFKRKLWDLIKDLLITGYNFYQVHPSASNSNVEIEVLDTLNTFPDENPNSPYIKDSYRIVIRRFLTKSQILNKYGKELSKEDIEKIKDAWNQQLDYSSDYIRVMHTTSHEGSLGIVGDREAVVNPGFPNKKHHLYNPNYEQIPVYEVEWIETDDDFVMQLYLTVRIGEDIYVLKGRKDDVVRSESDPSYCCLTVNGVYFRNRGSKPVSLVLACANQQDKYDLLIFYRDNLIANSGTSGDWIDESLIPTNLGVNWPERLKTWLAYKKQGVALLDTTQEGRLATGQTPINTIFNGYDDTIKAQAIQAIQLAILQVEETVSSITGVFRERLNGIETHDAVTNIKIGLRNSFTISKQWYSQMDLITEEMLYDCLNVAKVVYKNGLTGTLMLGDHYQKIFTALPEHFTFTDWDVHVKSNTDINKDLELIKSIIPEVVKAGGCQIDTLFDILDCKSLTQAKLIAKTSVKKQKEEQGTMQQLQQQVQQLEQQLKESQSQLQKYQNRIEQYNQQKLQIESQNNQIKGNIEMFKAQTDRTYKESVAKNDTIRTQIEYLQLSDDNPYNDEVKNIR